MEENEREGERERRESMGERGKIENATDREAGREEERVKEGERERGRGNTRLRV